MDVNKISSVMDKFEQSFDALDVRPSAHTQVMHSGKVTEVPPEIVGVRIVLARVVREPDGPIRITPWLEQGVPVVAQVEPRRRKSTAKIFPIGIAT